MSRRKLVAFVSSAALLVALLPGAAGAAQPASAGGAKAPVAPSDNGIYIVQMVDQPVVAYTGDVKGLQGHEARQRARRSTRPRATRSPTPATSTASTTRPLGQSAARRSTTTSTRTTASRPQLTETQADKLAGQAGVAGGLPGRAPHGRHVVDAELPRPGRTRRPLESARRCQERRRGRDHRHHRLGHLAGEPQLRRPRRQETGTPARAPSAPTSRSPAGTASAPPARRSTPRCATRS